MINEIDLFMNLLDENGFDKLLKSFDQNLKTDNLQLKKMKLMKIFRGVNNKRIKTIMSPFDFSLDILRNTSFEELNDVELFEIFSKDIDNKIPDYVKFANALYYYPEKTKKMLEVLDENRKLGNQLFKGTISFSSDEEIEKYFAKSTLLSEKKEAIIKHIKGFMDKETEQEFKKIEEKVKTWSLVDYYNNFIEESKEHAIYLIQLAYIGSHENKPEVEDGISLDMLFNFNKYLDSPKSNKNYSNELNENMEETKNINAITEELKKEIENINEKNKQLEKQIASVNKENRANKNKVNKYEEELQGEKDESKKLNEEITKLVNQIAKLKEISESSNLIKKENTKLKREKKDLSEKIKYIDEYLEYACESIEDINKEYLFAFIISSENKFCKKLFPEVLFIDAEIVDEKFNESTFMNIQTVYIQRNGLSNTKINLIERIAKQKNINAKIIMSGNEKELIEKIVKAKYMEGE